MAWIAIILGCAAVFDDLRRRAISNWISVSGIGAGLVYHTVQQGFRGLGLATAGAAVGFVMFLVCYWLGGMGGGDVKLMAAFGALLGASGIFLAALLAAIVGGLYAAAILALNRRHRAIPYAPAIVMGSWLTLLGGR